MRNFTKLMAALALLLFMTPAMVGWGQTTSIVINTDNSGVTGSYQDKEFDVNDITFKFTQWMKSTNIQAKKSTTNSLYNIDAIPGTITSIVFVQTGTARAITVYGGTSQKPTNQITSPATGATMTFDFSGHDYNYFSMTTPGNACYFNSITINYTPNGGQHTTYTVSFNAGAGTFVGSTDFPNASNTVEAGTYTLPSATPATGYTFDGWTATGISTPVTGSYTVSSNVDFTASYTQNGGGTGGDEHWVLTSLADLTSSDVFVIVGNGTYALPNDHGANSSPDLVPVSVEGTVLTGTIASRIKWTVSGNATDGYTFYPNGSTNIWLYCNTTAASSSNNNIRVGTGNRKVFKLNNNNYLVTNDTYTNRYLSIYVDNNSVPTDWRGYTSTGSAATMSFYKKVTGGVVPPAISASNVEIAYNAASGSISYTINNEPDPAGTLTAAVVSGGTISNLSLGMPSNGTIAFTCDANTVTTTRTATVKLTYTYGDNETVTKDVTITQAAAPVIYTTIPALFNAATSTEADVLVTFNNWVVSGASDRNVFVTDNNGNGFIIFDNNGGLDQIYSEGDVLSGTAVSCKLKLYGGAAELINLNASDLTITDGGTVSIANIAMANLAGVNTGSLVSYNNLTCSVTTNNDNTYYYLSDGTTTIQVYNTLYAFGTLENGTTYNITGVYQQFNSTKEILPRSAADIEYVSAAPCYTVTLCDDQTALTELSYGAGVTLPSRTNSTYTFAGWSTTNVGAETTTAPATIIPAGLYHPTQNIILYPVYTRAEGGGGTTEWHLTAFGDVDEGVYALVTSDNYAFNGTITSGNGQVTPGVFTFDNNGIATSAPEGTLELTFIPVEENGSIVGFKMYNATTDRYLYASGATSGKLAWSALETDYWHYEVDNTNTDCWSYSKAYTNTNNEVIYARLRTFSSTIRTYSYNNGTAIQLAKKVGASGTTYYTSLLSSYEKGIVGYGTGTGNYYLIASPVGDMAPTAVANMITDDPAVQGYDLYYFDPTQDNEWVNYKPGTTNSGFSLISGKGYLYANEENVTLNFVGTGCTTGTQEVTLTKAADAPGLDFPAWNLVGNPFAVTAWLIDGNGIRRSFYTMDADCRFFASSVSDNIEAMEGIFVVAEGDGEVVTFTTTDPAIQGRELVLNLSNGRSLIDRAIVRFDGGHQLPKFQLFKNSTKVYIPVDGQDYAIASCEEMGAMPVNFKAEENSSYTLSFNSENVSFAYLHLIDNMTGADVDLLQTPSYSFEAKTTDYANRFKLVFATGDNSNEDNFAFFSNGSFVINNDGAATLQVIDVTGRIVKSESINGCANVNVNAAAGVYMLRLINGDNVKIQKVVVR